MSVGLAVVRQPRLWRTAMTQWRATTPRRWWQRRPFLPMPSGTYLRFRMITQYGTVDHPLVSDDVLNYLKWCRLQHQCRR